MSGVKSFVGYFRCFTSPMGIHAIDATGEGVGKVGISCTPSKDFEKKYGPKKCNKTQK
jgi:hypothetical protein